MFNALVSQTAKIIKWKQSYFHAILTQQHFFNTLHTGRDSNLSPESGKKITEEVMKTEKVLIQEIYDIDKKIKD